MNQMLNLTDEDKALLEKLGLTNLFKKKPRARVEKGKAKVHHTIDLTQHSGRVRIDCVACNTISEKYINYFKRVDTEGYYAVYVKVPAHPVTREHSYKVNSCEMCSEANLTNLNKKQLIEIINNLR